MSRPLRHRLLLIQQADDIHQQLLGALEALQVEVLCVTDNRQALLAFREEDIDIVMIDIDLPGGRGIDLLDEMAADPRELPLIGVSRRNSLADVLAAVRHGATDYLLLPPESHDVIRHAMERAVERCELKRENLAYRQKLENANRELLESLTHLQQDQQAGKHVQQLLLPDTPKDIENYRFCHFILPSLYLSGDFVDYFLVGEDHAAFFVADVSGHGASSAFVTVFLKNLFARKRSDFLHRGSTAILSPAKMLAIANRELLEMGIGKHVTLCVGVVDLKCNQLCYSVAGHLPAPVLSVDGHATFLPDHDMPVGLFAEASFTDHMISFPPGAVLTLFSDGILEVLQRDSLAEKEQALLDLLSRGQCSSTELAESFGLTELKEAPDDIAILVVCRL
ncbi:MULTISPECIES: PP2C family protein-serine/threonine phosphatase [Spongiibacter]|uniref:PP2C family protein-serine/threonine phosphatase n=2 Tax=Spongiibacteraceae TaxID=1706375 RepID=UPI0003B56A02|nr:MULTISPECIES: fused response regulator/phosphatase [Spongiibacter]MAY40258.1 transcriptional regulator [Spongiibacter sp.]MBI57874.1 transcriptional regulator [Spongiibacter sp.]MBO6752905.1 SpoIIE family protein phosphatase [Spongiibacter sp.]MBU73160.1 transcriptional regulator [Spongiibacter sp.]|tara:strand:+ start:30457 stop:31638 length:1182 start_codon:yes stop_codon:yes gene_type:complete